MKNTGDIKDLNEGLQPNAEKEGQFVAIERSKSQLEHAKATKHRVLAIVDESA